ncbi:MAG: type I polyketide synthase, partial [Castellaniella sp.]
MAKRVALIGLSFRFPSTDTTRYWPDLLQGRHLVTEVDPGRWAASAYHHPLREHPGTTYSQAAGSLGDISGFDAGFFGISPREACLMDPQQRLLLELAWETMENAGVRPSGLRGSDCGVYIGISSADYAYRLSGDLGVLDAPFATGNATSIAANRISYVYDLRGPSLAIDTACSSSMVAFHHACRAIESGEISQALSGGISLHLHPYGFLVFSKASMLSRRGRCNAFDAAGDGYVRAEGGGLFLLKDLDRAVAEGDPILAIVAGTAINTDGHKSGLAVPSAEAQAALLRGAYARAGIRPDEIDYLEAHGTGTPVGDPIETRAIGEALGRHRASDRPLPIGSVKSNMGHLEAASGVAGLVKAVFSLQHRQVPATIGIRTLNPAIRTREWNLDIVTQPRPLPAAGRLVIGVNSFGFGGANAHVILHSPDEPDAADTATSGEPADFPLILSGRSPQALRAAARDMAAHLEGLDRAARYDAAYQAARRRDWHAYRALVSCPRDGEDPVQSLQRFAAGETEPAVETAEPLPDAQGPVFVYSGNGSQWAGMGRALLADPDFRRAIDDIDALFEPLAGYRLADDLAGGLDSMRLGRTEFAQPALFALQVGITRMLARQGIAPAAVMGHSVGEVAAAWACGALSLADAVRVIYHRSRLQGMTLGSGQMSAVGIDGDGAQALINELELAPELFVAGYNSARGATIAGGKTALSRLETALQDRGVASKRLDLDYAFHSPAMDGLQAGLADALGALRPSPMRRPFLSTVDDAAQAAPQLDAGYWWRNIRRPVRFEQAAADAIQQGYTLFIEIGPHAVLRGYLNDALKRAERTGRVLTTASQGEDDPARIRATAAQALLAGAPVCWERVFPRPGRFHALPTYPWQRERHWHPDTPESLGQLQRHRVHPLLGHRLAQHEAAWENQLDTHLHPALADHVVGGAIVFPGAGFAELALAAALQQHPAAHAELENLEIHAPLLLADAPSKLLRTTLEPDDGRMHIRARELGSTDDWTLHASARLLSEPSDSRLRSPLPAPPDRAPDFLAAGHEALMRAVGLNYGPAYQLIERGWRLDARTVLAALRPDEGGQAAHLAPARLDGAFQLAAHLLADDADARRGLAFVPVRVGRLSLRVGTAAPRYAQLRLRRRSAHALTVDISLYADDGEAIAALAEVSLRSVRLMKAAGDRLSFVQEVLTPRPRADAAPGVPLQGLEQALSDALAQAAAAPLYTRYAEEAEPLLDALCERYGIEALRTLVDAPDRLTDATLAQHRARTPALAPFLDMLLRRAESAGLATRFDDGWSLTPESAGEPAAADIWHTLEREYPEHFGPSLAAGRIGLRLPAMLQGLYRAEDAAASQFTHRDLAHHLLAAPARRHLARALGRILSAAQDSLPPGRRLRVLEVGAHAPWFGADCCAVLDFRHADYCYAATGEDGREAAAARLADYPDAAVRRIGDPGEQADAPDATVDLAIVQCDFDRLSDARAALHEARARLAPGAALILTAHHPARWADFVFGARPEWWIDAVDGGKLSMQQTPAFWRQELQALGCACEPPLELAAGTMAGAYVLHARAGELPETALAYPQSPSGTERWLLLADTSGPGARLAASLARALRSSGCKVTKLSLDANAPADTLPAPALSGAYAHVVHAAGLYADGDGTAARRCALAAAALRACE